MADRFTGLRKTREAALASVLARGTATARLEVACQILRGIEVFHEVPTNLLDELQRLLEEAAKIGATSPGSGSDADALAVFERLYRFYSRFRGSLRR